MVGNRDLDAAGLFAVTNRIVQEVAYQFKEKCFIAMNNHSARRRIQFDIDIDTEGPRNPLRPRFACNANKIDVCKIARRIEMWFGTGKRQQLIAEVHRAIGSRLHQQHRLTYGIGIRRAQQVVALQFEAGEWRAQLVSRRSNKISLRFHRLAKARQQLVHSANDGFHFLRHTLNAERRQITVALALKLPCYIDKRMQAALDACPHEPDDEENQCNLREQDNGKDVLRKGSSFSFCFSDSNGD